MVAAREPPPPPGLQPYIESCPSCGGTVLCRHDIVGFALFLGSFLIWRFDGQSQSCHPQNHLEEQPICILEIADCFALTSLILLSVFAPVGRQSLQLQLPRSQLWSQRWSRDLRVVLSMEPIPRLSQSIQASTSRPCTSQNRRAPALCMTSPTRVLQVHT